MSSGIDASGRRTFWAYTQTRFHSMEIRNTAHSIETGTFLPFHTSQVASLGPAGATPRPAAPISVLKSHGLTQLGAVCNPHIYLSLLSTNCSIMFTALYIRTSYAQCKMQFFFHSKTDKSSFHFFCTVSSENKTTHTTSTITINTPKLQYIRSAIASTTVHITCAFTIQAKSHRSGIQTQAQNCSFQDRRSSGAVSSPCHINISPFHTPPMQMGSKWYRTKSSKRASALEKVEAFHLRYGVAL